jgi:aspartyl aminopeptidase
MIRAFAALLGLLAAGCPGAPGPHLPMAPAADAGALAVDYRAFLDRARTPARAVSFVREHSAGWREVDPFDVAEPRIAAGDRLLFVSQHRTAILVVVGDQPIADRGLRIIGAHIDTPSPRLDLSGLTRKNQAAIPLHPYGGMRRHHWPGMPVAIVGRVARAGGQEVEVSLGLDDDYAFFVSRKGDDLVLTTSTTPTRSTDRLPAETLVDLLHRTLGLTARDLEASELYAVPRHRAREVGLDRDLIGGHGQDDRVNSYAAWRAVADLGATPAVTSLVWLVDREEIGSTGRTGARARFFELVVAWLLRGQGERATEATVHRALAASRSLSADTPAGINPNFPEVQEARNAPVLGAGPALFPFTGRGGKNGGSAARAELIASVRAAFDRAGAALQYGELGRVDEGGGGTIAKYLAHRGVDVVDVGVPVVSMHSPMELSSVRDIWAAYRGFRAWLLEEGP